MSEKTQKILTKIFKKIFLILFISFSAIYISERAGYTEYKQHTKKVMTEQQIKKFEQALKKGENIDMKDYLVDTHKNYESKISRIGNTLSVEIEKYVVGGLNNTFKFLNEVMG